MTAYNETCAAVGNDYWNHRLFLLHGEARYIDVLERTLYNGLLSGVSLDGKSFFYPNPLESAGQHKRSPWFGVACCPGNITRFLASLAGYVYAQRGDSIYVNLFIAGTADIAMASGNKVQLVQATRYPWDGDVRITVSAADAGTVHAADPRARLGAATTPCRAISITSLTPVTTPVTLSVNGQNVPVTMEQGYAVVTRDRGRRATSSWLHLPMPVRRVVAIERRQRRSRPRGAAARSDRVRCGMARQPGRPRAQPAAAGRRAASRRVPADAAERRRGDRRARAGVLGRRSRRPSTPRKQPFIAIPYYAWANRGPGEMSVWLADREDAVRPLGSPKYPTAQDPTPK